MVFRILSKALTKGHQHRLITIWNLPQRLCSSKSIPEMMAGKENFHNSMPQVIDSIASSPRFAEIPEVAARVKKILNYNLTGGKCLRGLLTVMAYQAWEQPDNITEESLKLSRIMGWCVEMFHVYFIILDDIIDESQKRRNKPCWHLLPNVGTQAVNDTTLLYSTMLDIININFRNMSGYNEIKDLFNNALLYTSIGQHLDYSISTQRKYGYSMFTEENYNKIIKYKTTFYTFDFPVCLGMILANKYDEENIRKVHEITDKIGRMYQIQNDYLDVYGVEYDTENLGTDIQEGKCSWLAVKALQFCSDDERKLFTKYYGSNEPAHVELIKTLYEQLDITAKYKEEERSLRDEIVKRANNFGDTRYTELFLSILNSIYNRKQ